MSIRILGAVAALSLLAAPAARAQTAFDISQLRPATLEYQFTRGGTPIGQSATTLSRDGEGWKGALSLQFGPVRQTIEARWDGAWRPLDYMERYSGPFEGAADVRLQDGRITGTMRMPAQMGGEKTFDAAFAPGTSWSVMNEAMLSTAHLAEGMTIVIPFFNTSTGTVQPVTFEVGAVESVTVPAGTFQAHRVRSTGGSSEVIYWLRAAGPHYVVRQEVVGQGVVGELTAVR
jgi:Protein of unknown function (DUF3108)